MMVLMDMLVAVYQLFVTVGMLMNQIGLNQKIRVEKKILRLAVSLDVVLFTHDDDTGGNLLHDIQVLRAEDEALIFFRPLQ